VSITTQPILIMTVEGFGKARVGIPEYEKLKIMIDQVNNLIACSEGNEFESYLISHLSPVYYELNRQLSNLHTTLEKEKKGV